MKKQKREEHQHVPGVPDVPTKNGHYMGKNYGFDYADGEYTIALCMRGRIEDAIKQHNALQSMIEAHNSYLREAFLSVNEERDAAITSIAEEYGLPVNRILYVAGGRVTLKDESEESKAKGK